MADSSKIEWTDTTWNPTTGCDKVSPGCDNCYACGLAKRLKGMGSAKYQNDGDPRTSGPGFGLTVHPDTVNDPFTWKKPRKVFVNSMSDLFHDDVPNRFIAEVFAVMAATPQHTYQVLTKRHGRMRSLLRDGTFRAAVEIYLANRLRVTEAELSWPLPNVWLGVSVEDQKWADIRIPALLDTPAAVRFLSCEPLLGPVDLEQSLASREASRALPDMPLARYWIDWVIVGGESGPGARPMDPAWARSLRDQCQAGGVPFHFKQWGAFTPAGVIGLGRPYPGNVFVGEPVNDDGFRTEMTRVGKGKAGRVLDGRTWDEFPLAVTA
jgi:protein gp37